MAGIVETLRADFKKDAEFAEGYADSFLDTYVATQIKVIREQREWTQADLAEKLRTAQTVVSRIENANYSSWSVSTLKRIAKAFGVRLHISFETYGSLLDDVRTFDRTSLKRDAIDKDPAIQAHRATHIARAEKGPAVAPYSVIAGSHVAQPGLRFTELALVPHTGSSPLAASKVSSLNSYPQRIYGDDSDVELEYANTETYATRRRVASNS